MILVSIGAMNPAEVAVRKNTHDSETDKSFTAYPL